MIQPTEPLILTNATVITPYRRESGITLVLQHGKIEQMGKPSEVALPSTGEEIDLEGHYVLPGFIDIHVHGGCGHDFSDKSSDGFLEISRFHASHGTTSLIATVYAQPKDDFLGCLERLRKFCERDDVLHTVEGIHLEGPYLNPEMHGAIRPDFMWESTIESFHEILNVAGPWARVMSIAPEIPGALEIMRTAALMSNNPSTANSMPISPLYLSIGHSNATYEQLSEAIDCGLEGVTHIFNAMPPIHHRKPGVLTGTLLRDELFVEVIADAVHLHPAILQLILKVKDCSRILLISDAIRAAGQPDGNYIFSGQEVIQRKGRAYLAKEPDTLAGSTLTMDKAFRTMVKRAGVSLEQAAQMASLNAARVLRWKYRRGIVAAGKDADLVVLNKKLKVDHTIKAGKIIYSRG